MKTIKTMLFTTVFLTFALVWMSMGPSMQGMPISAQLSNVANTTIMYLQQLFAPVMDFYYRHMV
jgi:hypothetical protein